MCMFCFAAVALGASLLLVLLRGIASFVSSTSRQLVNNTCAQVCVYLLRRPCRCFLAIRAEVLFGGLLIYTLLSLGSG